MQINWMMWVPGMLVLFYPLDTLLGAHVRLHDYEHMRNGSGAAWRAWLRQPWFWMDPVRAFAGGWMVRHAWTMESSLPGLWKHLPLIGTILTLGLALVAQMHTRRDRDTLFAPIGYTAGLLFVLLPPQVAILVVALSGACLMAFRGWSAFFLCGAIGAGVFGYLILKFNFWMAGAVILMMEPILLSLLAKRELVFPVMLRRTV